MAITPVPLVTSQNTKDFLEAQEDPRVIDFQAMTLAEIDDWIGEKTNVNDSATLFQVMCRLLVILRSAVRETTGEE